MVIRTLNRDGGGDCTFRKVEYRPRGKFREVDTKKEKNEDRQDREQERQTLSDTAVM